MWSKPPDMWQQLNAAHAHMPSYMVPIEQGRAWSRAGLSAQDRCDLVNSTFLINRGRLWVQARSRKEIKRRLGQHPQLDWKSLSHYHLSGLVLIIDSDWNIIHNLHPSPQMHKLVSLISLPLPGFHNYCLIPKLSDPLVFSSTRQCHSGLAADANDWLDRGAQSTTRVYVILLRTGGYLVMKAKTRCMY